MPILSFIILFVVIVIGIVLTVALVAAIVAGWVLWSAGSIAGLYWLKRNGRRWPWAISLVLAYPLAVLAGGVLIYSAMPTPLPPDQRAYEYAFDTTLSPTVKIHDAKIDGWGDWEEANIHFTATPSDIAHITTRGLIRTAQHPESYRSTATTPFGPVPLAGKDVYRGRSPDHRFSTSEEATLIYDPATGEAWYWYEGID